MRIFPEDLTDDYFSKHDIKYEIGVRWQKQ